MKRSFLRSLVVSTRLSKLVQLTTEELAALGAAEVDSRRDAVRTELTREGELIRSSRGLQSGWAFRQRIMRDGQRQIIYFLIPGDVIGSCRHHYPVAATTTSAATDVETCPLPEAAPGTALAEAYARNAAFEEHLLIAQVTRIGCLDAHDRIVDWLLETHDRLEAVGLAANDEFALPLTQELLADTLGLTPVHTNRMLQALRREGLVQSRAGMLKLVDRKRLVQIVDYNTARISSTGNTDFIETSRDYLR